jgi:hypothetical protein
MLLKTGALVLTPEIYDLEEEKGRALLSNRVIEAFQPQVFNTTGYPVHVTSNAELWRYVDVMHETRLKATVEDLLKGLTPDEFTLFQRAVNFMIEFTTATFGRPLRCENALMRAMNIFRYIRAAKPQRVMEFGPGSGYLGLLHILDGISYIGIENSQAFYLLQNRMWSAAAKGSICELVGEPMSLREAANHLSEYSALHVPWWKAIDLDLENSPVNVDLVTANHCLAEMHGNAMKYCVRLAHAALKSNHGPFIFEGWGYELLRSRGIVTREFNDVGFRLCHVEERAVAFSADRQSGGYLALPRRTSVREKLRSVKRRFLRMETFPHGYEIASYSGPNSVSAFIQNTQANARAAATVTYRDVNAFLANIYGKNAESEEERFLELIGKTYS